MYPDYDLDDDEKRKIIRDRLSNPETAKQYFSELRERLRTLNDDIEEVNTSHRIDDLKNLISLLGGTELGNFKELLTSMVGLIETLEAIRKEHIYYFDIAFFTLEELVEKSLFQKQSSGSSYYEPKYLLSEEDREYLDLVKKNLGSLKGEEKGKQ